MTISQKHVSKLILKSCEFQQFLIFGTPAQVAKTVILNKLVHNLDKKSDTMVEFQQFFF